MKSFVFFLCFFSFSAPAIGVLDILKNQEEPLALQKKLKGDIGSLLSFSKKTGAFIKAFENKNFEKALSSWLSDVKSLPFAKSSTGEALYAYLLFKNGFKALALKRLLEKARPKKINPIARKLWQLDIDRKSPVWDYFFFPVSADWQNFLGAEAVFKIGSKKPFQLKKDQKYIESLLALPLDKKTNAFPLEWPFILSLIQKGDMAGAAKILAWKLAQIKNKRQKDMIYLTIGRLLADIGEDSAALSYYSKTRGLSYFWLLAQEEKAWIFLNQKNYSAAYSTASVFEHPELKKALSPYMFLILALSQLKACDYKGVFRSLRDFKAVFSKRDADMERALKSKSDSALKAKLLAFYDSKKPYYEISPADVPYSIKKDKFLKNHILLARHIQSQNPPLAKNGPLKLLFEEESEITRQMAEKARGRAMRLLRREKKKISEVLKNFHIIEAEVLYRIYGFHSILPANQPQPRFSAKRNRSGWAKPSGHLIFPFNPDEIWLDELPYYKAEPLENCPKGSYIL